MIPSPCFIVDVAKLKHNLEILKNVKEQADCRIVLALKGFSLWHTFPLISEYLDGCCASGKWEATLAHRHFKKHILTYSPAYKPEEIEELLEITSHLDFNSPGQWLRYKAKVMSHPRYLSGELKCGIRVNPEHSTGQTPLYDPCSAGSRLGATLESIGDTDLTGITGIHFHTLCEQYTGDLETTLEALDQKFGHILNRPEITWLNMGGGHWITKPDYDRDHLIKLVRATKARYNLEEIWLEPGEAIAIHTGVLECSVIDLVENNGHQIAILDVSATGHMPDVLEMPYRPDVLDSKLEPTGQPGELAHTYRLGCPTCLAGDVIGDYSFNQPLQIGDRITFDDMAHYTMVKTTTFNGVPHPAIALRNEDGSIQVIREFSYADFEARLG